MCVCSKSLADLINGELTKSFRGKKQKQNFLVPMQAKLVTWIQHGRVLMRQMSNKHINFLKKIQKFNYKTLVQKPGNSIAPNTCTQYFIF